MKRLLKRPIRYLARTRAGMTLIEVLVAIVIFAIILLAVTGLMDVIQENNTFNHHFTVATFMGQMKMEEMLNLTFASPGLDPSTDWTPRPSQVISATGLVTADGYYKLQWRITADQPEAGMKKLQVRSSWVDGKSIYHQVGFSTAKAPFGNI